MKKTTKGADSKNKILEAAIDLFAEKGYRGTKISDIVKAAGLTQAAFYLYFSSKESIFQEILERFYMRLEEHLQAAVMPSAIEPGEFSMRIRRNIESILTIFQEHPKATRIFLTEERSIDEVEILIHQTIASNLKQHQSTGLIRNDLSPHMMANGMIGLFIQVTLKELLEKQRSPKDVANEITEVLLYGLAQYRPEGTGR
ncbi:TetR/AcrR family transcriptional regulator [Xylanibacillus composti]|uniref:Putative HTH-type transcriptional regulator YdgC n=1 Tax=Xylanibacillus composti TaxID=1572762 RepID=A0A8J4M119_9BACL|nr:TetR/AcrR family transcriptional regulator [Xylanibacillus composti]MDT9723562.1 TetR/AcrR family transcriptional regulator [Xylanibacillus composti]GIQ68400.1 putative HTH-type transcriptional regulator YdgC [Xylanibacillus composti]